MPSDAELEAAERIARYQAAKEEWAAVKAARAAGEPEPDTPNLDALAEKRPLAFSEQRAEDIAAVRSAAAHKAWETRRRNAGISR